MYSPDLDEAVLRTLGWAPEKTEGTHTTDDLFRWHSLANYRLEVVEEVHDAIRRLAQRLRQLKEETGEYPLPISDLNGLSPYINLTMADGYTKVRLGLPYEYERFDIRDAYVCRRRGDTYQRPEDLDFGYVVKEKRAVYAALADEDIALIDWCRQMRLDPHLTDIEYSQRNYGVSVKWCLHRQLVDACMTRQLREDTELMRLDPSGSYFLDIYGELLQWTDKRGRALQAEERLVNTLTGRYRAFLAAGMDQEHAAHLLGADGTAEELVSLYQSVGPEYMASAVRITRRDAEWAKAGWADLIRSHTDPKP